MVFQYGAMDFFFFLFCVCDEEVAVYMCIVWWGGSILLIVLICVCVWWEVYLFFFYGNIFILDISMGGSNDGDVCNQFHQLVHQVDLTNGYNWFLNLNNEIW